MRKGIPRNGEEIRQCLQARGWQREHMYQVYLFQFIGQESESVTRRYYQVEMERLFQECGIRNLSLTDSASWDIRQALFIHRTTLLFRLQRIELLTGLNWENWEDRIHLAMTFELMKRNGEIQLFMKK